MSKQKDDETAFGVAAGSGSDLLAAAMQWAEGTKEHAQHCALDKDRRWLSERGIQRVSENNGDIAARVLSGEIRRLRGAIEYIDRQVRECWPVTGSDFSDVHRLWCIKVAREALNQNAAYEPTRQKTTDSK